MSITNKYEKLEDRKTYHITFNTRGYVWSATGKYGKAGRTVGGRPCHSLMLCPHIHILTLFEDRDEIIRIREVN